MIELASAAFVERGSVRRAFAAFISSSRTIFGGDEIATIEHDESRQSAATRYPGSEEWRILSQSGLPLATGIYVFTVESDLGKQIGKFVILR